MTVYNTGPLLDESLIYGHLLKYFKIIDMHQPDLLTYETQVKAI